jgi:cephalosporin hydroxylase
VFAILDSDHSKAHVLQELRVIARLTHRGDRVVVEDR